ncbi:SDR family NAD(P)-dependent oxidoreductase [Bradyrhizobium japonicum]
MADDKQWREMTADPKFRRVLVTNGRSVIGQEAVAALKAAGAKTVFVGIAEPWRPFAGEQLLRGQDGIEIVTLDAADEKSAADLAADIGGKVDILVNTTEDVRPGGLLDRRGTSIARDEIDQAYLGFINLAQAFGPAMRMRVPMASTAVPPGSTFSRSMRWRTGLPLAPTRPRKRRACRSRTAFVPSSGPAASG